MIAGKVHGGSFRDRVVVMMFCVSGMAGLAFADSPRGIATAFESTVVRMNANPSDQNVPVEWTYTNHWDIPLLVERFDSSCGCLSGQLGRAAGSSGQVEEKAIAPGKSGTIRASFTPGLHRGLLRKSLHVRFVGYENPVELIVEATIPSHVELSLQELVWKIPDQTKEQFIDVTSGTGKPFQITSLPGLPENQFTLTTETLAPGTHYRLRITPTASASGQHCLQVRTDSSDPRDQLQAVFLSIQSTPSGP